MRRASSLSLMVLVALCAGVGITAALVRVDLTVDGSGVLEPLLIWPVRSPVAGVVQAVAVATGDSVEPDETLVRFDPENIEPAIDDLAASVTEARLDYEEAVAARDADQHQLAERIRQGQAALVRTRASLRQRLVDFGLPDKVDSMLRDYRVGTYTAIDIAIADVQAAGSQLRSSVREGEDTIARLLALEGKRAALERLTWQLRRARTMRGRLLVRAPATGIVLTEGVEQLTGAAVREGDLLLEIADPRTWHATLYVSERDVHKVHLGDLAKIEVQALAREHDLLQGRVTFIAEDPVGWEAPSPGRSPRMYRVVATIDGSSLSRMRGDLHRGYSVRGKVISSSGRILTLVWAYLTER